MRPASTFLIFNCQTPDWDYTGEATEQSELKWDEDNNLWFTYPVKNEAGETVLKTCQVLCGFDTGHMELMP